MPHHHGSGGFDDESRKSVQEQLFTLSRAVLQQSPNALLIARVDGVIEYVNPSFTRLTGYTPLEVVGEYATYQPYHHRCLVETFRSLGDVLHKGGEWRGEIQDQKKNGQGYWAMESISPILGANGEVTHVLVIRQDITQQKRDQEALRESEERFRQVAEMTGEWLWEQDPEGRYSYSSGAVLDILGYRPEEIIGMRYLDLLMPSDRVEFEGLTEHGKGFCHMLNHYRHKHGQEIFTESTGEPIFDADGRLIKWRGVDHNITARKHYEDALRLRNRAIEAASVGISITDALREDNPNIYVNPALCRMTGYSREELIGQNMRILRGPDTDLQVLDEVRCALQEGRGCEVVLKNYRKNGTPFWNELLVAPVQDERGQLTHYIGIQADISERRKAEEERHELDIARQIQLGLLPKAPLRVPGAVIAGVCAPAQHVGGDYFDFFAVGTGLDAVIADVSGHSVGAALIMAEARSTLRAEVRNARLSHVSHGPREILKGLSELLHEDLDSADLFISMFYLRYDPLTRTLSYANAGHNYPLLLRAGATACELLEAEGMIMGVEKDQAFEEKQLTLAPGDRVLLYTDGIIEAQNEAGDFFGIERLCQLFSNYRQDIPQAVSDKLLAELCVFCQSMPCEDDVTLVVLVVE